MQPLSASTTSPLFLINYLLQSSFFYAVLLTCLRPQLKEDQMVSEEDKVERIQLRPRNLLANGRQIKFGQSSTRKRKCLRRNRRSTQCSRRSWQSLQEIANLSTALPQLRRQIGKLLGGNALH